MPASGRGGQPGTVNGIVTGMIDVVPARGGGALCWAAGVGAVAERLAPTSAPAIYSPDAAQDPAPDPGAADPVPSERA